ncbi:MAG: SRPBCC family protein [Myxococcaceae bacterium]
MDARKTEATPMKNPHANLNPTTTERKSDRELVVTRTFNGPARLVYQAWTQADLFKKWWVPKSFNMNLLSCELDVRVGGGYKLVFQHPASKDPISFFGKYTEVVPNSKIVWTNEEEGHGNQVTTVTFEEKNGKTLLTMSDLYPSKAALDEAMSSGATSGHGETFDQLEALLAANG